MSGGQLSGGQLSNVGGSIVGGQLSGGQLSGGQLSRGQLSPTPPKAHQKQLLKIKYLKSRLKETPLNGNSPPGIHFSIS